MILIILFVVLGISNLYFGSQSLKLYQSGQINTTKRLSLKILNNALANEINNEGRKKLLITKSLYIVYLLIFYSAIIYAIIEIYVTATTKL
jgi:hypothetical protein